MSNITIQETFTLPSHAKVYDPDLNVKETFSLRSMTTNEEMLRLSPSEHKYENMAKLIDRCMIDSPGISAYDMCLGDYMYCLYMLRMVTYGPVYKISPTCVYCGNVNNEEFNIQDLALLEYNEDLEKYLEVDLPVCGLHVTIEMQTPRKLDNILDRINMYKKKMINDLDSTVLCEVMSSVRLVDGIRYNEIKLEDWVRSLSMRDINTILNYAAKLNDAIGIDNSLILTCEMCTLTYKSKLSITSEFFRPTLDI